MATRFGDNDSREERILQGKPSEKDLGPISKEIGGNWKILLNQLGVSHAKITSLLQENSGSVLSACWEGLVYWRKGNEQCEPATWSVLLDAIETGAEMKGYAQKLRDQLLSKKDQVDVLSEELRVALKEKEDREQQLTAALEEKEDREQQLTAALKEKEEELKKLRQITIDPSKPMEEINTSYFYEYLKQNGISDDVIAVFRKNKISGTVFRDLTEEDLKDMDFKMGDRKLLLQLQEKHMPEKTLDSSGIRNHGRAESRLAEKIKPWCKPIFRGRMSIYELPKLDITQDYTNGIATVQVGPSSAHLASSPGKVLMLVGATGAGKTTLINAMVNYLFGVEWEDDFRFKMIVEEAVKDQTRSVTKWITAYTIPAQEGFPVPYTLTIIDTPGFGDTEGIEWDELIVKQVKELFSKKGPRGIDQLHGIGFVAQSALAKLTPTQRYIFDSILAIFGKDVGKNVFMMITFADGQRPPVLDAVKAAKISYETAFKFNNSAIYCDKKADKFNILFWEMGMSSLHTFFTSLGKMAAISLQLTHQVLDEHVRLGIIMKRLQDQIQKGLDIKEDLRQTKDVVKQYEEDIERYIRSKNPAIPNEPYKTKLKAGEYSTNCPKCDMTCLYPCYTQDTERSPVMRGGYCTVCPGKCHWSQHVNNQYLFQQQLSPVMGTVAEQEKNYQDAKSEKSKYESIVGGLERDLEKKGAEVYENILQVRECVRRLDEIALKPKPLSEVECIELMIESEKQQKKPGFNARIATLMKVKEQAKPLSKLAIGNIERLKGITRMRMDAWRIFIQDDN